MNMEEDLGGHPGQGTLGNDGDPLDQPPVEHMTDDSAEYSTEMKEKSHKVCGVCNDAAKSYHFGGLCCNSCKAFFRRVVQSQAWETFLCVRDGECQISQNRRSCQACRYELCKKIGMDPSMVMNQEERKALMFRKLERRKQQLLKNSQLKQLQAKEAAEEKRANETDIATQFHDERLSGESVMEWNQTEAADVEAEDDQLVTDYQDGDHSDDCIIIETLSPKDCEKIKGLQKILRVALAFPAFPQHYYEEGADVHEHLFFVFCKSMGKFFSLIPEFRDLEGPDQRALLKDAVAKAIFIFGAHQFQEEFECWPRRLLSTTCSFPTISLASTEGFIDNAETYSKMRIFMRKYCKFFDDEIVMLLCLVMLAFDDSGPEPFIDPLKVAHGKNVYTQLLEAYLHHQNPTMPLRLFTSQLLRCFEEVRDLKERFQSGNSNQNESDTTSQEQRGNSPFASSLSDLREDSKMPPKKAFSERVRVRENLTSPGILCEKIGSSDSHSFQFQLATHHIKVGKHKRTNQHMPRNEYLVATQDHNYQKPEFDDCPSVACMKDRSAMEEDEVQVIIPNTSQSSGVRKKTTYPKIDSCTIPRRLVTDSTKMYLKSDDVAIIPHEVSQRASPVLLITSGERREVSKLVPQSLQPHSKDLATDYSRYQSMHHSFAPYERETYSNSNDYRQFDQTYTSSVGERILMPNYEGGCHDHSISKETISSLPRPFHYSHHQNHAMVTVPNYASSGDMGCLKETQQRVQHHQSCQEYLPTSMQSEQCFQPLPSGSNPSRLSNTSRVPNVYLPHQGPQPTQSPLNTVCRNMNNLSTHDDTQLVQAVQNVLPPRLVNHLVKRLGINQREQL